METRILNSEDANSFLDNIRQFNWQQRIKIKFKRISISEYEITAPRELWTQFFKV